MKKVKEEEDEEDDEFYEVFAGNDNIYSLIFSIK